MSDTVKEIAAKLKRVEETTGDSGAIPNTPKSMMIDASPLESANPQYKYRFVNMKDTNKVERRLIQGYEKVPASEGGQQLGSELLLMRTPRDRYEARIQANRDKNRRLTTAHRDEMEQVVESVARMLRDKYGLNIPANRILVEENS